MHINLAGKTALVTASTGGIGFAIAHGLALTGAIVIINGRSDSSVEKALARLSEAVPRPPSAESRLIWAMPTALAFLQLRFPPSTFWSTTPASMVWPISSRPMTTAGKTIGKLT